MPTQIIDTIKQKNGGTFAVAEANDLKGGHYQVATLVERNNIPEERRKEGMLVTVDEDETTYELRGGLSDAYWKRLEKMEPITEQEILNKMNPELPDYLKQIINP